MTYTLNSFKRMLCLLTVLALTHIDPLWENFFYNGFNVNLYLAQVD